MYIYYKEVRMGDSVQLCDDMLAEILCRCAEKDLIRFKCVSNNWYHLISQVCIPKLISHMPRTVVGLYFETLALSDHAPGTKFRRLSSCVKAISDDKFISEYASLDGGKGNKLKFDYMFCASLLPCHEFGYTLCDSRDGLLLFVDKSMCQYYVCNPTFRQCVQIPKACAHTDSFAYSALAFNASESHHYKVVCSTKLKPESLQLDVYSSNTEQWLRKVVQLDPLVYKYRWVAQSVYLDGVMYRLSFSKHLLCVDLNVVSIRAISLPVIEKTGIGCIGISMGRLCYAKRAQELRFFIWSLEGHCDEAGTEWVLKHTVPINHLVTRLLLHMNHPENLVWFEPHAFCPDSDVILFGTPCMILSYDFNSKKFEEVFRTRDGVRCYNPCHVVTRSLVPLNNVGVMGSKTGQLQMITDGMEVLRLEFPSDDHISLPGSECMITGTNAPG